MAQQVRTNFEFLQLEWPEIFIESRKAERYARTDPRTSAFYSRRALELVLKWLFSAEVVLRQPYKDDLNAYIHEPSLKRLVGQPLASKMDVIRLKGNQAVHQRGRFSDATSVQLVRELWHVCFWLAADYARDPANRPVDGQMFDDSCIPPIPDRAAWQAQQASISKQLAKLAELQAIEAEFAAKDDELRATRVHNKALDAQIAALRAQIAAAKQENAKHARRQELNEDDTRSLLIDTLLQEAGWALDGREDREYQITGNPGYLSASGKGVVDYVLWDDDGKPLAIVEAKASRKSAEAGHHQAVKYAGVLEDLFHQRPLIYLSNGYTHYFIDDAAFGRDARGERDGYPRREVFGFRTKNELRSLVLRRRDRISLAGTPVDKTIAGRGYQKRAIAKIGDWFQYERQRRALLVMATGTGKTRTAIALTDVLARAGWAKRVLFLADRRALINQAAKNYRKLLPDQPIANLLDPKSRWDASARIYFATYPTMLNLINQVSDNGGETAERIFGPGFFDLIIIDEAHRSIFKKYAEIFEYFDSLLLGLTATPKDEVDRNTYRLFQLEDGMPTDYYGLDEAIEERVLVPWKAIDVPTSFMKHGILRAQLSAEEQVQWDELEWDEQGTVPDSVGEDEINTYLFNRSTVEMILESLVTLGQQVDGGARLGKTIVFAKNQKHAEFIFSVFTSAYPAFGDEYAAVITNQSGQVDTLIEKFERPDSPLRVAISVDMLDTGIDVPCIANLVFFKPVRSRTKFWQMVGRGTRTCPELHGPATGSGDTSRDKKYFFVFDVCDNFPYFNAEGNAAEGRLQRSLSERLVLKKAELLLQIDGIAPTFSLQQADVVNQSANAVAFVAMAQLRADIADDLHARVVAFNKKNIAVRRALQHVERFEDPAAFGPPFAQNAFEEFTRYLAPLPPNTVGESQEPTEAKRFDLIAYSLQLALLQVDASLFVKLQATVIEIAENLLTKLTIPQVKKQAELLEELAGDAWWQDVTLPMLEHMRRQVRGLAGLVDRRHRAAVYTDFQDELGEVALVELKGHGQAGVNLDRLKRRAEACMAEHDDNLAVQKLRRNRPLTSADVSALESIFLHQGLATAADLDAAKGAHEGQFGLYLRSIVGVDRAEARAAFDELFADQTFSASQHQYLDMIVNVVSHHGYIDIDSLYEPPFTGIALSPDDIFPEDASAHIIDIVQRIKLNAAPEHETSNGDDPDRKTA